MTKMTTLVIGASTNPTRYSYQAMEQLQKNGYHAIGLGKRQGQVGEAQIVQHWPELAPLHTITLYLNPKDQATYLDEILRSKPQRVIFNPATENPWMEEELTRHGIRWIHACTLVLLATHQYEQA